jgi:hypothetical protein
VLERAPRVDVQQAGGFDEMTGDRLGGGLAERAQLGSHRAVENGAVDRCRQRWLGSPRRCEVSPRTTRLCIVDRTGASVDARTA